MSAFQLFESFYRDAMSHYLPQGEALLERVPSEIWARGAFRYIFSVPAMIAVSRIIEDAAASSRGTADLHVSFQYISRFLPQLERYRMLSVGVARGWIYGALDVPDLTAIMLPPSMRWIDIRNTPLTEYWFVVAYGPGLSMALLAREIPSLDRSDRYYEGFYAFDRDVAYELLLILHLCFPRDVPAPSRPEELEW